MPTNVFVSFDHNDQQQVDGFRSLIKNPNHPLDFHDHSLKAAVVGKSGKPLNYPALDKGAKPVRKEIINKLKKSSKMIILVGRSTHSSDWVKWEIETFYEQKKPLPGRTKKRIRAMRLSGCENSPLPSALKGRSTRTMIWDPKALDEWIDENPGD